MQVGTALHAPDGYLSLEKGLTYYFLRSNRHIGAVQLVLFTYDEKRWLAHQYSLPRNEFEAGLADKLIVEVDGANGQPPFLRAVAGKNLRTSDLARPHAKQTHTDRVEARLLKIAPLLERKEQILSAPDPQRAINEYATTNRFNAQRIRFWFYTYLCFGQDSWTLFPLYFNCGRWDRLQQDGDTTPKTKWGRPSIARGAQSGQRLNTEKIEMIKKSYLSLRREGKTLTAIYQEAARKYFNAQTTTDERGQKRLISRDETPVPTFDQYRYQLQKALGPEEIQRWRWGETRHRRSAAVHKGKYSSSVSNLLERTEADAYYCEDRPKGIQGEVLSPLCVARIVDVASGLRLGIGFSFGAETSEAYNAAQFCAAISKKKFCRLFGIDIEEDEWPSQGLSPHLITDRGPGIKREPGHKAHPGVGSTIREFTPSGQGQSKGIVESAQRRRTNLEGPAQYSLSDLSFYNLAVREIRRLLTENQAANASEHMTPEMIQHRVMPNPLGVWNFLDSRSRNDGQFIPFDDAVRRFLHKTTVRVGRDGVWLRSQRYHSEALRDTKLLNRISNIGTQRLTAYVFPSCVRYIWVEINNYLVEVDAQLNLRDDKDMLYRPYTDLEQEDSMLKQTQAEHRQHRHAVAVDQQSRFKNENGESWHSGRVTKQTPPKRSRSTRIDEKEIHAVLVGKEDDVDG